MEREVHRGGMGVVWVTRYRRDRARAGSRRTSARHYGHSPGEERSVAGPTLATGQGRRPTCSWKSVILPYDDGAGLRTVAEVPPADLTPGSYLLICLDDDVHSRRPHFLHGMARQIVMTGPLPASPE